MEITRWATLKITNHFFFCRATFCREKVFSVCHFQIYFPDFLWLFFSFLVFCCMFWQKASMDVPICFSLRLLVSLIISICDLWFSFLSLHLLISLIISRGTKSSHKKKKKFRIKHFFACFREKNVFFFCLKNGNNSACGKKKKRLKSARKASLKPVTNAI